MNKMNIFFCIIGIFVVGAIISIGYLAIHVHEKTERNRELCSDHNMSSVLVNRGNTVLCFDPKSGMVFYLR